MSERSLIEKMVREAALGGIEFAADELLAKHPAAARRLERSKARIADEVMQFSGGVVDEIMNALAASATTTATPASNETGITNAHTPESKHAATKSDAVISHVAPVLEEGE
jgi:zinc transporter ZupT